MDQLIKINTNSNDMTLSGRDLHEFLEVKTPYAKWFERMAEYGFDESTDYLVTDIFVPNSNGGKQTQIDHEIKLDMAKEIAMIQRNEKGKQARKYFLDVEKKWNSPEMIMKRALEIANKNVENLMLENNQLEEKIQTDKPKVLFSESVENSNDLISVKEMATLITQSGFEIGQNELFEYLRKYNYLCSKKGSLYHLPTKKYERFFKVTKRTIQGTESIHVRNTPKINGKGQLYFIKKFAEYKLQGLILKDLLKD